MTKAAAAAVDVARHVSRDQFAAPTPWADWDVRALTNHLTLWSAFQSELAARKQAASADQPLDENTDFTRGQWPELFAAQAEKAVAAWAEPAAWTGTTRFAGTEMPAELAGAMVLGELVLHGWDLARATGQELACDDDAAAAAHAFVAEMAPQGREMGLFATEVSVPGSAPPLDRVVALSGRDPRWRRPA